MSTRSRLPAAVDQALAEAGVVHGDGVVVACLAAPSGDDFEVTVAFKGQGVKRLLATYAMLEKLA